MTREQHEATRELEAAQARWLQAYGWRPVLHGRWFHEKHPGAPVRTMDAMTITRAQPLIFGYGTR